MLKNNIKLFSFLVVILYNKMIDIKNVKKFDKEIFQIKIYTF